MVEEELEMMQTWHHDCELLDNPNSKELTLDWTLFRFLGLSKCQCKGCNGCAALEHSIQHHAPQQSTHVGWTHNATTGIAHIPSVVPVTMGNMVKHRINHIVRLGV